MAPIMKRTENCIRLKAEMEENLKRGKKSALNYRRLLKSGIVCRRTPTKPSMKHSIDELAEIFHEQALFKKYPDFHDYVKKSYPEWFEDQHLINLKREFRKDFLCELDFFDIEEKKCQNKTDEDDGDGEESYYCNKCYCHHSRESEKQGIENEGKSRKEDDEKARKEDEMSCDIETIRRELMKLMEKEQQKDATKQNCQSSADAQAMSVESYLKDVPSTSNAHQNLERSSDVDGDDESSSGEQSI